MCHLFLDTFKREYLLNEELQCNTLCGKMILCYQTTVDMNIIIFAQKVVKRQAFKCKQSTSKSFTLVLNLDNLETGLEGHRSQKPFACLKVH